MGYIRKPAVEDLKNRRYLRDRVAAERAPEVRPGHPLARHRAMGCPKLRVALSS